MMVIPVLGNGGDRVPGGSGGNPGFYLEVLDGSVTDHDGDAIGEAEFKEVGAVILFEMTFPEYYPDFTYHGIVVNGNFVVWGLVHAEGTATMDGNTLLLEGTWWLIEHP